MASVTELDKRRAAASGDEPLDESDAAGAPDAGADAGAEDLHPDEAEVLGKGKSLEDRANDGEAEEPDEGEQMQFPGTQTKLSLNAGGAKPTSSLAKIAAISLPMKPDEQMLGEEEVIVTMRCQATFVGFRTLKKGGKQREHTLVPIELISVQSPS